MDTKVKFIGKVFVAIPLSLFYTSLYLSGSRWGTFPIYEGIRDLPWLLLIDSLWNISFFLAPPIIHLEECSVENTKINLVWSPPESGNVDCYIVEIDTLNREGDIHQERNFTKVYQGPRTKYTLRGLDYNVTVVARVKALNTAGESEPSDKVSLSTEKGAEIYF